MEVYIIMDNNMFENKDASSEIPVFQMMLTLKHSPLLMR